MFDPETLDRRTRWEKVSFARMYRILAVVFSSRTTGQSLQKSIFSSSCLKNTVPVLEILRTVLQDFSGSHPTLHCPVGNVA